MALVRRRLSAGAAPTGQPDDLDPALTPVDDGHVVSGGEQETPPDYLRHPRVLLRRYGIRPQRRFGQNFLTDATVLEAIVDAAEVSATDTVLEIGPGLGALTERLADRARAVVAVEVDPDMRRVLADTISGRRNVTVVDADILEAEPHLLVAHSTEAESSTAYKVVANLPYNITSAALRHILESPARPTLAVVTVQREVAERIAAKPGQLSVLGVAVQYYAVPRIVRTVPAAAFFPRPKVDSAVVRLDVRARPPFGQLDSRDFFAVVRAGFSQRRKQLRNSLAAGLRKRPDEVLAALEAAGIDARRRAETLSLDEWSVLSEEVLRRGLLDRPHD